MNRNVLLMDYYELTMCNSYFLNGMHEKQAVFDLFFRTIPDNGGYAIYCGLESIVQYIKEFKFGKEEIEYLKSKKDFDPSFLEYLKNFKFKGDIYSFKEGSVIFPLESVLCVKGNLVECQLIETALLTFFNHQSLIATKSARIVRAALNKTVMEFGARRAQGNDAATLGARASYIAGCIGTSNVYADFLYNIKALGTMAHSYVQSFSSEYEAFCAYAKTYPDNTLLLVDTYNTLKEGIPNAIRVHNEILKPLGKYLKGIRIDSGDLAYLSREARKMLDKAGLYDTKITVSNSLDEYLIISLNEQGAKIDSFGVGERLITAKSDPVFGGVYKLSAIELDSHLTPSIKVSDNPKKTTTPGFKKVYRIFDENSKAIADLITLRNEKINPSLPYVLFDPLFPYKEKVIKDFKLEEKLIQIFKKGKLVYELPNIESIRKYCKEELDTMWEEVLRFDSPHEYYVDLSKPLYNLKQNLIKKHKHD